MLKAFLGTNADRVGYGDPTTTRLKTESNFQNYLGLPYVPGVVDRWIPTTTVNDRRAFTDAWMNERNNPYVVQQLQNNPFALPPMCQMQGP